MDETWVGHLSWNKSKAFSSFCWSIIRAKRHLISLFCLQLLAITDIHSVSCHIAFSLSSSPQINSNKPRQCLDPQGSSLFSTHVSLRSCRPCHSFLHPGGPWPGQHVLAPSCLIRIDTRAQSLPRARGATQPRQLFLGRVPYGVTRLG